ncbi:hypothetical protein JCM19992_20950 [Thermostilla marina]
MVRLLSRRRPLCLLVATAGWVVLAFAAGVLVAASAQESSESDSASGAITERSPNSSWYDEEDEILPERLRQADPQFEERLRLQRRFLETVELIEQMYVEPIDRDVLYEAAVRAMLSKLDSYSTLPSESELPELREAVDLERIDVGIDLVREGDAIRVLAVSFGSPAQKAGIVPGDYIEAIDGISTKGMTRDEAASRLRGEPGTRIRLTVSGDRDAVPADVELIRERLTLEDVVGWMRRKDGAWRYRLPAHDSVVYVRITRFGRGTSEHLESLLRRLEAEPSGIGVLVLDLRYNPGGVLQEAAAVCDLFLEKGTIVTVRSRDGDRTYTAHPSDRDFHVPMYVLVNRYSASAAEVTAACLQDHDRATIVGERTYGKGTVQSVLRLTDGKLIKLTTGKYVRPNGRDIHRSPNPAPGDVWGVDPNPGCAVRLERSTVQRLLRRWGELAGGAREETAADGLFSAWIACDPQFQIVLNRLQSTKSASAAEGDR